MEHNQSNPDPNPSNQSFLQRNSASLKGVVIFFLMLVLLIPSAMIEGIIYERQNRRYEAVEEVSGKWGRQQTVSGPILALPYELTHRNSDNKETHKETKFAFLLPDELRANGNVLPEKRHRGIFEVVLYNSKINLEGSFNLSEIQKSIPANAEVIWDKAVVLLGIPDLRGLQDQVRLDWDGKQSIFDPGIPISGPLQSGIHAPLALSQGEASEAAKPFKIELSLKGSGSLFFCPVGKVTNLTLSSTWADPSFSGAFLPDNKTISSSGFEAAWKILNLNRNYPQHWNSDQSVEFGSSAFGVDFLLPVDNYQKSIRSVKYAILFIGLSFLTIFFIEMRQLRRVHPFQYALIGLALVIFYTLLVSISEQLSFDTAYLIAAAMTIGLTGLYARSLFQSNRMAAFVSGTLGLLYGFLFVVLQQQDYALLIGSLGLFAILAVVMYASRKINWQG